MSPSPVPWPPSPSPPRRTHVEEGKLLVFPNRAHIETDLRRFAVDEKRCCQFWGFAVDADSDGLTLRWDGPPDSEALIARLLAYCEGDEPLTSISGLPPGILYGMAGRC